MVFHNLNDTQLRRLSLFETIFVCELGFCKESWVTWGKTTYTSVPTRKVCSLSTVLYRSSFSTILPILTFDLVPYDHTKLLCQVISWIVSGGLMSF